MYILKYFWTHLRGASNLISRHRTDSSSRSGRRFRNILILLLLAGAFLSKSASAHSLGQTYLYISMSESALSARFEVTAEDLNSALGTQLATDGSLVSGQLAPYKERIATYLNDNVRIALDGEEATLNYQSTTLMTTKEAQYVLTEFRVDIPAGVPEYMDVEYDILFDVKPKHLGFLLIENDWRSGTFENESNVSLTFLASDSKQRLDLTGSTILRGMLAMLVLGMQHIIEGIDHVMFLLAVLLTSVILRANGRWEGVENFRTACWYLFKIVTLFTVAHTITLSLTTFQALALSPRLVESVIAGSIVIIALEVFYPIFRSRIGLIVFILGLFHGAGFAGILLSMKIHPDYLPLTLLGFNLGIELGQIAVVFVLFPLFYLVRTHRIYLRFGAQTIASGLILVASYWFIERAFDVDLPAGQYAQQVMALLT